MGRAPGISGLGVANGAEGGTGWGAASGNGFAEVGGLSGVRGLDGGTVGLAAVAGGWGEFAGVDDHVVAFAVSEGLGDGELERGGFEGEGEFGELSATLGDEFAEALAGEDLLGWDRVRARRWRGSAPRAFGHFGQ